jgi:hypothetical protein
MPAPREILDLVTRFEQQFDAYKSGQYNETQVRREFLDPFFKALGCQARLNVRCVRSAALVSLPARRRRKA